MFLPRQLEAVWRAVFSTLLGVYLVLTGSSLLHLYRAAPQTWQCTLIWAGRLSRQAGNNLSPKAKLCEESYMAHQGEPRNTLNVVRLVKRL